jgi:Arc/MetJ family transcription regulator
MHINRIIFVHCQRRQLVADTNIDLDEKLLTEAMELTRAQTKKEVIHLGLRELIRLARLRGLENIEASFTGGVTCEDERGRNA